MEKNSASVNKTPRLSPFEEQNKQGRSSDVYFREPNFRLPQLTDKEKANLFNEIKNGDTQEKKDKARETVILSNLRLVVLISRDYENLGLDRMDLINEGNIGLMTAVERFDVSQTCKFSYYAGLWIRQRMIRALERGARTIRVPNPVVQLKINILRFCDAHENEFGVIPSNEAICKKFKITDEKRARAISVFLFSPSLNATCHISQAHASFKEEFGSFVEDKRALPPNKIIERAEVFSILNSIINQLSERERKIIYLRFGLKNNDEETLDSIGKKFKVTRERVRQIEAVAILKIKKMMHKQMEIKNHEK